MKDEIKEILFLLHNDRLTESGKRKLEDYITNLQEKYERMKENAETLSNGCNELEQRNEKAIEYMKKWGEEPDADMYMQMKQYKEFQYLLNILQNGEQNWEWIPVYNTTNSEGE